MDVLLGVKGCGCYRECVVMCFGIYGGCGDRWRVFYKPTQTDLGLNML